MAGIPAAVLSVMVQAQGIDRTARELNRIHGEAQKANRGLTDIERQAKRTGDATTELNQRFTRLDRTVGDFNRTMMGLRNVVSLIRWPALIAGAGLAAKAIDALAAGAVGLVSALGPLVGLGAAAGVGLTALAQGAGTVKLAFADLGKALGGNKKALAALVPAQRQFLGELKAMQGQVKQLKQAAAGGMFPGLTQALKNLTPLFGPLRGVIAATGKEFGNLAVQASRSMQGWGGDLQRIGGTNVKIIHNLGLGAISLANAFRSLVVAGGPLATWMSQVARGWADWINKQVQAGRESGRLAGFLDRTRQVMIQLGHIGGNLAVTLFNIGKAASPLGRSLMGTLEGVTRKWREWTGSITGQNAMRKYFDDAKPGILAIGGLVGDLAGAFVRLGQGPGLAGMVGKLRDLVPVLENVISTTTAALGPVLLDAVGNLVRLIGQVAGTSGALTSFVRMLGWMAGALADVLTNNPMLSAMVVNLVAFGGAVKAMRTLFSPLTGAISTLIGTWGKVTGGAALAQGAQQRAMVAAEEAGTVGAASVGRLAGAWAGVGAAAGRAAGAGAAAGATGIRSVGAATTGGVVLPPGPTARGLGTAETATVSKFQGLTGKLSSVANTAMRGIGIGVGGIVATSIASTLVGGGAGKWIQALGTGASLGGALGSIFGPAGAAGGAVIGGLVGSVAKFIGDHANAQGKQWADGFLAPFGPAVDKKVRDRLADDYKQMQNAQDRAKAPALPTPSARFPLPPRPADTAQRKTEDFNAIFNTQYKTGADAAQKWITEFGAVRIKTMPAFVMDARLALDSLPVYAQQSAAKQMILYAQSLQANGQLPKGAVNQIIESIQGRYAALGPWLAAQGLANSQQVAATMKFDGAVKNLVATQNQMRAQFGLWSSDPVITGKNYIRNLKSEFDQLQWIAATTTGKAHDAAVAGMRRLHTDTVKILDAQLSDVQTKFAGMKASIATNTTGAATAAGKGFYGVWWNIDQAMRSSVISTNEGGKRVSKALVSLLEAFGSTKIPKAVIDQTTWAASAFPAMWGGKQGTQGGQASPRGHARGGLTQIGLPGQRGLDTVPLNVGGTPIKVAPGEQVAVFNHDQQMVANAALAPMGGLPGLFSKIHRPHHTMASGGFVPGFQAGGTPRGTAIPGFYTQAQLAQLWAQANPGLGDPRLMAAIAMAESGGNSQIVNSIGACVPLASRILTRRGWLTYDEVQEGDETLGYNPVSGQNEWTRVTTVHYYENQEVWQIGSRTWKSVATPNHRWWTERNPDGGEPSGEFATTSDLGGRRRLVLAARADTGTGIPDLSVAECAILGWLQSDGSVRPAYAQRVVVAGSRNPDGSRDYGQREWTAEQLGWDACIYQAKPGQIERLRALLVDTPHTEHVRQRSDDRLPAHEFQLRRNDATELLDRADWPEIMANPSDFVLRLSQEQRAAWLTAMIDAEGTVVKGGNGFVRIAQIDGSLQEAIKLAVYLEGFRPSYSRLPRNSAQHSPAGVVGMCSPYLGTRSFEPPETLEKQAVWCVTTELGTWTMEQGDGLPVLTGNSGLWQIHPPEPGVLDPMTNARIAGRKLRTQGLRAWEAYTNGAYRRFLGGAAAGPMGAMPIVPKIPTPKVAGGGTMAQIVQGGLGKVTEAANAYIANAMSSIAGGIGGAGVGAAGGPTGTTTFQGVTVANWVAAALRYASGKGASFRITSGYRPGVDPHTSTGASEHQGTQYPHGAVDFGGYHDAAALAQKMAVVNATRDFKWPLLAPIGFVDDGHASGTGHQLGGMVANYAGAFAQGGAVTATSPTLALFGEHGPETAMFVPHFQGGGAVPTLMGKTIGQWWGGGGGGGGVAGGGGGGAAVASWQQTILGEPGPLPLPAAVPTTLAGVNSAITTAEGVNSTIVQLQSKYGTLGNFFDLSSETLLDPTTGAVNADQVQQRVGELQQLEDIARQIWEAYQKYIAWIQLISEGYKAVIAKTQTEMATVTRQESRLQTRLRSITDVILPRLRKMRDAIHLGGLKGGALTSAKSHQAQIRAAIATYGGEQAADKTGITNLEKRKTALRETITTATGGRDQYAGTLLSEAGNRDSAWIDYLRIQGEKAGVAGTQAQPVTGAGGAGGAGGVDTAALQTLLAQANQRTAVSQAQYAVLQNWPPKYLGRAAAGGMVTVGERGPELVSLPVGASVYPNSAYQNATQPIEVHVHVHDGAVDPNKIQVIAEGAAMRVTRGQARSGSAASRLPGSRGGI